MRFNNQLTVEKLVNLNLVKMSESAKEASYNSSDISDSIESAIETNNNNSTMSDSFSWSINKPDLALTKVTKSFAVLCEGESEIAENPDFKQAPTSR